MSCKIKTWVIGFALLAFPAWAGTVQPVVEELPTAYLNTLGLAKKLPFTSWGDLTLRQEKELIDAVTNQADTPVLRYMVRTVLTERTALSDAEKESEERFVARLEGLLRLGYPSDVLAMIDLVPAALQTEKMDEIRIEALLSLRKWQQACSFIHPRINHSGLYWQKANMMCLALKGEQDKALLAFSLWQEEQTRPLLFTDLMDAFLNGSPLSRLDLSTADQTELFLMRRLGILFPERKPDLTQIVPFQNAVHVERLLQNWQTAGISENERLYRLHVLFLYAQLFRPDLRFLQTQSAADHPRFQGQTSLLSFWLRDKPQSDITGADLLRALLMLSEGDVNLGNAFLILNKGGLDVEAWVLELIH